MTTDSIKELVKRLKQWGDGLPSGILLMREAASALEAMAGEVERVKSQRDEYLQFWKNNAEACEAAEAERDRLKAENERLKYIVEKAKPIVVAFSKALGGDA